MSAGVAIYSDEFEREAVKQVFQGCHPVADVAKRLGVSSKSIYAWLSEPLSTRERDDVRLIGEIGAVHEEYSGNYGSPRVRKELRETGEPRSENRVAKLKTNRIKAERRFGVGVRRKGPLYIQIKARVSRATHGSDFAVITILIAGFHLRRLFIFASASSQSLFSSPSKCLAWRTS